MLSAEKITDRFFLGVDRSVSARSWTYRLEDERTATMLAQRFDIPELVARVLVARGVAPEDALSYLNPSLRDLLPDPSTLADMDVAAARIAGAIMNGEAVAVFGDYDVDGATSSALLSRFFRAVGAKLHIHIPDRIKDGYGPNARAMLELKDAGVDLTVTVDCGVLAYKALGSAADAGLDVIVLDHHLAEPTLPPAVAVVNPNRLDDISGQGHLAAVGVVFLTIVAVNRLLREAGWYGAERPEPDLREWLDLVALGTVCDVVPLIGVNRALVIQGLKIMRRRANKGLAALGDVARMSGPPGTYHAGFLLGPRVNAGGRVGRSDLGAELLSSDDEQVCKILAQELDVLNTERQAIEAEVLAQAITQVELTLGQERRNQLPALILAAGRGWHPGVIGIVAARLREKYDRPALVVALDDQGVGKGSARSIGGVDLGRAVTGALEAGLLVNGGGHAMAAGLTVKDGGLEALEAFLLDKLGPQVAVAGAERTVRIDGALSLGGATRDFLEVIDQAGPYGAGNPEPRFALPAVKIVRADVVGQGHVRCILAGEGARLKAIAFRAAETPLGQLLLDRSAGALHLAGRLRADDWQGRRDVQFSVEDAAKVVSGV